MCDDIKDLYVMASEPLKDVSIVEIRKIFKNDNSEGTLAEVYAAVSNKYWWVKDDVYDFEEGTEEYNEAARISDEWLALVNECEDRIMNILKNERQEIPDAGLVEIAAPFMERYGFINGSGWWIKEESKYF